MRHLVRSLIEAISQDLAHEDRGAIVTRGGRRVSGSLQRRTPLKVPNMPPHSAPVGHPGRGGMTGNGGLFWAPPRPPTYGKGFCRPDDRQVRWNSTEEACKLVGGKDPPLLL
jgi:hypothetical protein